MKNDKIGEVLKSYRKRYGLHVHDVAIILHDKYQVNVADKTIYGWESNQAHPTSDVFLILCEIYHIYNIAEPFFQNYSEEQNLFITAEERALLLAYRNHPHLQDAVKRVLEIEPTKPKQRPL